MGVMVGCGQRCLWRGSVHTGFLPWSGAIDWSDVAVADGSNDVLEATVPAWFMVKRAREATVHRIVRARRIIRRAQQSSSSPRP